jgi:hypothetical protein
MTYNFLSAILPYSLHLSSLFNTISLFKRINVFHNVNFFLEFSRVCKQNYGGVKVDVRSKLIGWR